MRPAATTHGSTLTLAEKYVASIPITSWGTSVSKRPTSSPVLIALALGAAWTGVQDVQAQTVDFQRDVRPILADKCFQCHGPDSEAREAELRFDTREGAFAERRRGQPIVPGDAAASVLFQRVIHTNARRRMPPASANKTLTDEQVDILRRWIDEGASWDQHWSFKAVERPEPPVVADDSWVRSPLDRFVLARLEAEGLQPALGANKRALIRRLALDLTGLPPEPELVQRFLSDDSDQAYESIVDELLASPQWGEHRARYWLDAARYGDTHGIHIDNYREIYPYRDWVIKALNENRPFDEFTVAQVAGDLLPNPSLDDLVATGFQRNNITTNEGGVLPAEYEVIYAKDRAETIGGVFLGLTVGCATCHDHKFDPIQQREFYALTAFFRNTTENALDGNVFDPPPILVVPSDDDRSLWNELRDESAANQAELADRADEIDAAFGEWLGLGEYRSLTSPLAESGQWMHLDLDESSRPRFELGGTVHPVTLEGSVSIAPGPGDLPSMRFGDESWAELPSVPLAGDSPFSMALWIFRPDSAAGFPVAGQYDAGDGYRGWALSAGGLPSFRLIGDSVPESEQRSAARISPRTTVEGSAQGQWTHVVVTHDGTAERSGMAIYRDGERLETGGTEYFAKALGSSLTDGPLELGRSVSMQEGEQIVRHFPGGGIADFRIFDHALTDQEVRVVSAWPTLRRTRDKTPEALTPAERDALRRYYLAVEDGRYSELLARSRELTHEWREVRRRGAITHIMQERTDSEPQAHILYRGMYDQPLDLVTAGVPSALPPMAASLPHNRLGLARWLVDDENPLTARVTVNRFWQQVFGTGLVATSEDFGAQGEPPTHPELLDWLAVEFRDSGWDVKRFFRTLVTSATYRQSARVTAEKLEADPENRLLSRGPRFRMDAEMVRDYALAASGLLTRTIGGPSVRPYQPEGVWSSIAMAQSDTRLYAQDDGDDLYRRSLYTFWKRLAPPPSMGVFDAPTREHSVVRRERTNTPLQALVTMNDPQFVEASRYLSQRAIREAGDGFDQRLDFITARLLARPFDDDERAVAMRTYGRLLNAYRADTDAAERLLQTGDSRPDATLPVAESAAWTMLVSQLMNLDEVLNK